MTVVFCQSRTAKVQTALTSFHEVAAAGNRLIEVTRQRLASSPAEVSVIFRKFLCGKM
jgi:hypothetical protein